MQQKANWLAISTLAGLVAIGVAIRALADENHVKVCGHHGRPILVVAAAAFLALISLLGARKYAGAWEGGAIVVPAIGLFMVAIALLYLPGSPHGCGN